MRQTILTLVIGAAALIAAFIAVAFMWAEAGVHMNLHGWIAYGLGCTASIALATGLFYLTFKSSRDGYDDLDRPEEFGE